MAEGYDEKQTDWSRNTISLPSFLTLRKTEELPKPILIDNPTNVPPNAHSAPQIRREKDDVRYCSELFKHIQGAFADILKHRNGHCKHIKIMVFG